MKMHPVASATLQAIGYNEDRHWLDLRFRDGVTYRYLGVQPEIYAKLAEAPSKGEYFNQRIRGRYLYTIL